MLITETTTLSFQKKSINDENIWTKDAVQL